MSRLVRCPDLGRRPEGFGKAVGGLKGMSPYKRAKFRTVTKERNFSREHSERM